MDSVLNFQNVLSFKPHASYIPHIKQSPFNNKFVATCSFDKQVKIWTIEYTNWTLIRTYSIHSDEVFGLEWIDNDTIASSSRINTLVWSLSTGLTKMIIVGAGSFALKLLNDDLNLAIGLLSGQIDVYNIKDGSLMVSLKGHSMFINDIALISKSLIASSSQDKTIRIWDLTKNTTKFILAGHFGDVRGLKLISLDILASASSDSTIKLWNITSGILMRTLNGHTSNIQWSLDLLNDGQTLVSGSWDHTIKLWNWTSGQYLNSLDTGVQIYSLTKIKSNRFIFYLFILPLSHF